MVINTILMIEAELVVSRIALGKFKIIWFTVTIIIRKIASIEPSLVVKDINYSFLYFHFMLICS